MKRFVKYYWDEFHCEEKEIADEWDGEPYDLWECQIGIDDAMGLIDWFYKNHFDVNNLIPKGLAIDATGLNIY